MKIFTVLSSSDDFEDIKDLKIIAKRKLKFEKDLKDSATAKDAASKFLEENPHVNIGFVIEHLQDMILSTVKCAEKLGISPSAFLRLRKKYNLYPVYSIKNSSANTGRKRNFMPYASKQAIRNFYTPQQLEIIPSFELNLIQIRAARSLKYPCGKGIPWKWTRRGHHPNGKLKARTDNLKKLGINVIYDPVSDKYNVKVKNYELLSRKEVDKLNFQYGKLKVFT